MEVNQKIVIRTLEKQDIPALEDIVRKTWNYDQLCERPQTARTLASLYLKACLIQKTLALTALVDGRPAGVIMGQGKEKPRRRYLWMLKAVSLALTRDGRRVCRFYKNIDQTDKQLLSQSSGQADGELVFFVLDENARGLGVGGKLWQAMQEYFLQQGCRRIYVFTDNSCNYGFYEHQGFIRTGFQLQSIPIPGETRTLEMYIYEKELSREIANLKPASKLSELT